jgi:hypothetical protein
MQRPGTLVFPGTLLFIGLGFGALNRMRVASNPRLAAMRAVDEFQLISVDVCFGMAFVGVLVILREIILRKRQ